jgi:hypothetical protein
MQSRPEATVRAEAEIAKRVGSSRSIAAKRSHDRRRAELLAAIARWEPDVQIVPIAEIRTAAIASYNSRYKRKKASIGDNKRFLDRIAVNHIRHRLTRYDGLIRTLRGRTGKQEAVSAARDKTLTRIAELYPDLFLACGIQCTSDEAFRAITRLPGGVPPGGERSPQREDRR